MINNLTVINARPAASFLCEISQ